MAPTSQHTSRDVTGVPSTSSPPPSLGPLTDGRSVLDRLESAHPVEVSAELILGIEALAQARIVTVALGI